MGLKIEVAPFWRARDHESSKVTQTSFLKIVGSLEEIISGSSDSDKGIKDPERRTRG